MKRILLVLGCYGFVVGSAEAAQWSAETCGHLEEMRAEVAAMDVSAYYKAVYSIPILINQHVKCGVENRKQFDAANAMINTMLPMPADTVAAAVKKRREPARRPLLCDTTPKANGGSTTDCF
jgi:hypothetical protein